MSLSRRMSAAVAGSAAVILALSACAGEAGPPTFTPPPQVEGSLPAEMVAQLEESVAHAVAATGATGAIVGVWAPWSGSWVAGTGTQTRDSSAQVTTEQSFRIAQVTRLMTCDVLYALDSRGIVSKNASVSQYVSGVPDLKDVTLLDLCNGTAGIGEFRGTVADMMITNPERQWGPLELAAYGVGKPRTEPRTTYRESDAAYMLLGLALERVSGKTAAELIDQYVAQPLELSGTELPAPPAAAPAGTPLPGYHLNAVEGGVDCTAPVDITVLSSSLGFTDSGAVSTVEELGRYVRATAAQALPASASSARWSAPLPVSDTAELWHQATGGAHLVGPLIGQFGSVPGYATAAFSDPDSGFTVVVVLNSSAAGAAPAAYLAWELAAIAAMAPAASGQAAPEFALPFTAETQREKLAGLAVTCVEPPEEEPAEETEE